MAKKKSKKRRPPPRRPAAASTKPARRIDEDEAERPASRRAERKEEARRERERRIKAARRRERNRKLARWGVAAGVVAVIGGIVFVQLRQSSQETRELAGIRDRLGCTGPVVQDDQLRVVEGLDPTAMHSEPFVEGQDGHPATAGPHSNALPGDVQVFDTYVPEANVVHNLEHGYVIVYYADQGEHALPEDTVSALADLVESEDEVFLMPYEDLASSMALVSWGTLEECSPTGEVDPDDAVAVARGFIGEWRNNSQAPEASA